MNRDTFTKWLNRYAEARIDMQVLFMHDEPHKESKKRAQKAKQKLLQFHKDWYKPVKKYPFDPLDNFIHPFTGMSGREIIKAAKK